MSATSLSREFVGLLMDPLPDEVLLDTQYNLLMRMARRRAWREAEVRTRFLQTKLDHQHASDALALYEGKERPTRDECWKLADEVRAAKAAQILIPAPDLGAIAWKKRAVLDRYIPLTEEAARSAILADEAWMAAHPVKRARKQQTA